MAKIYSVREKVEWSTGIAFDGLRPGESRMEAYLHPDVMEHDSSLILLGLFTSGAVHECTVSLEIDGNRQLDGVPAVHYDSSLCKQCEERWADRRYRLVRAILLPPRGLRVIVLIVRHESWSKQTSAQLTIVLRGLLNISVEARERARDPDCQHLDCQQSPTISRACSNDRQEWRRVNWRIVAKWLALAAVPPEADLTVLRRAVAGATAQSRAVTIEDVHDELRYTKTMMENEARYF